MLGIGDVDERLNAIVQGSEFTVKASLEARKLEGGRIGTSNIQRSTLNFELIRTHMEGAGHRVTTKAKIRFNHENTPVKSAVHFTPMECLERFHWAGEAGEIKKTRKRLLDRIYRIIRMFNSHTQNHMKILFTTRFARDTEYAKIL